MTGSRQLDLANVTNGTGCQSLPLEVIQASLDEQGRLRNLNSAGHEFFASDAKSLVGSSFFDLLLRLNPEWAGLLPEDFFALSEEQTFLHWNSDTQPGLGWNLILLATGKERSEGAVVSLVPGLSPDMAACASEEGMVGQVGPAMNNLFFRTQQIEARFRQFLRLLPGVPYAQNKDLAFSYRNEQLRSMIGGDHLSKLEEGANWVEWIHPEDHAAFEKSLATCLSNRAPVGVRFRLQLPDDDRVLYIFDLRIPVRSLHGEITGYEGLWLDLTRQTLAEKRLQRAAWKESLAEISGSLSHDFNNVITGIVNLADLMSKAETVDRVTYRYDIKIIRDSARQAQQLIQRIISLNREHVGEINLHNLVEIIQQQKDLIRIVLPRNVQLDFDLPEVEIPVRVDQSAIRRILLNFTTNARDAVKYQGKVKIAIRLVELADYPRQHLCSSRCPESGKAAELVFKDDGCGIEPKIIHRIFDPYFSTKQASRGSGLGLYSMTQFAQENGFDFGVKSTVGEGTEMLLLIPVERIDLNREFNPVRTAKKRARARKQGILRQVALLAEFDESVVLLTRELFGAGFQVENFVEPSSACKWLKERAREGDLFVILMDHRKLCPDELADQLRSMSGTLRRILCVRGFNPDEISHLDGDVVDNIFEEYGHPRENLKAIISNSDEVAMVVE